METSNTSFLSLQNVFEFVLMVDGGNSYNLPNVRKRKMSSIDQFKHVVERDPDIYNKLRQKLSGSLSSIVLGSVVLENTINSDAV